MNIAFLTSSAEKTLEEIATEETLPFRSVQDLYPQMDGYNCGAFLLMDLISVIIALRSKEGPVDETILRECPKESSAHYWYIPEQF